MTNTNFKHTPNIYGRPHRGGSHLGKRPGGGNNHTGFKNPWNPNGSKGMDGEPRKILFLSKRGMSRSPVAREIMRSLIEKSDHYGKVMVLAGGVSKAYDECHTDGRMKDFCKQFGYQLQTYSRFADQALLADAGLIITLDRESEEFVSLHRQSFRCETRPFGIFMAPGSKPYVSDPFERGDDLSPEECCQEIIFCLEFGCSKLLASLPTLLG